MQLLCSLMHRNSGNRSGVREKERIPLSIKRPETPTTRSMASIHTPLDLCQCQCADRPRRSPITSSCQCPVSCKSRSLYEVLESEDCALIRTTVMRFQSNKTNCNNFTLVTRMNKLHGLWTAMTQKNILSRYVRLEASTATRKYCISEESKAGGSGKSFWRSRAGAMWVPLRESRLEHQAAFLDFVDVQYSTTTAMPSVIIIGAGA
jgi:REP element-mobilizing transposase RayT